MTNFRSPFTLPPTQKKSEGHSLHSIHFLTEEPGVSVNRVEVKVWLRLRTRPRITIWVTGVGLSLL